MRQQFLLSHCLHMLCDKGFNTEIFIARYATMLFALQLPLHVMR